MTRRKTTQSIYRLAALVLAVCCMLTAFVGCAKEPAAPAEPTAPVGIQWENDVPFIKEDFEGDANAAIARGDALKLEVVEDNGSKVLQVSGRTEAWNGINFAADAFRGNTITASAKIKAASATVNLSLQYDLAGTTAYTWIATGSGSKDSYTVVTGDIFIPQEATNVFVYIESSDVADIFADNVSVTVKGDYTPYLEDAGIEYADIDSYESLHKLYADYFNIGCAIPTTFVSNTNQEYIKLVTNQFNTITLENEFKPDAILDRETSVAKPRKYNESPAVNFDHLKETLDYCRENNILVRGHTLTWHSQTPEWLFHVDYDVNKEYASRELMLTRMENYIKSVLKWCDKNYPDLFYAWDVTNEAIDDGTNKLRADVPWTKTVGDDWVEYAFKFARKYAGEGVQLFYNDYNSYQTTKRDGIIKLLEPIAAAGNIDGVGMQGHISTSANIDQFVSSAKMYAEKLGVVVNVTELDIEIPGSANPAYDQGVYFKNFFKALIDARKAGLPLENVTIWGLCDNLSWKADKSPVLFNGDLSKKIAFDGMVAALTDAELEYPEDYIAPGVNTRPIFDDYEGDKFVGGPRFNSTQSIVTDDPYEGEHCLRNTGGESYDGYSINITNFIGHTIAYSFAVKSTCEEMRLTAEIDGVWPTIETIDTSSGEWVFVEGTYEVPADATQYSIYFETINTDDFFIDNLSIQLAEDAEAAAE